MTVSNIWMERRDIMEDKKKKEKEQPKKSFIVIRPKDESSIKSLRKSMMAQKSCCRGGVN